MEIGGLMKFLKSIWAFLDGKKTIIACIYWSFMLPALNIIYPNGIPGNLNKITLLTGLILSALGLGHKAFNYMSSDKSDTSTSSSNPPTM
jgi:hypothetical protein